MGSNANKVCQLTKTSYILGLQCDKALWLETWQQELKDAVAESDNNGKQLPQIKALAQGLMPSGSLIPSKDLSQDERINLTELALRNDTIIYDACFLCKNCFVVVDILCKSKVGWELYDVNYNDMLDSICLEELAFQYYVVTECGLPIAKTITLQLNRKYIKQGKLEPAKLFISRNITRDVKDILFDVSKNINLMNETLEGPEPDQGIGIQCYDLAPCAYKHYCWYNVPYDSVLELQGAGINKFACYRSGTLRLEELPPDLLRGKQRLQVEAALNKKVFINHKPMSLFLKRLWYPRSLLSISDISTILPLYDGLRPFQNMAISYSIHTQEHSSSKLIHSEYLPQSTNDPRRELLVKLLDDIHENSCILVYDKARVAELLKGLVNAVPELARKVRHLLDNMIDLMEPFKAWHIYSWKQRGDHSIESVLNAFVKERELIEPEQDVNHDFNEMWFDNRLMSAIIDLNESNHSLSVMLQALSRSQNARSLGMGILLEVIEQHNAKVEHIEIEGCSYETL